MGLGLMEWARLPQCTDWMFKSPLKKIPTFISDIPQIGLPSNEFLT